MRDLKLLLLGSYCLLLPFGAERFRGELAVVHCHFLGCALAGTLALLLFRTGRQALAAPLRLLCLAQMTWSLGFLAYEPSLVAVLCVNGPFWLLRKAAMAEDDGPSWLAEHLLAAWAVLGALLCLLFGYDTVFCRTHYLRGYCPPPFWHRISCWVLPLALYAVPGKQKAAPPVRGGGSVGAH